MVIIVSLAFLTYPRPINHGKTSEATFLQDVVAQVKEFAKRGDLFFTLVLVTMISSFCALVCLVFNSKFYILTNQCRSARNSLELSCALS